MIEPEFMLMRLCETTREYIRKKERALTGGQEMVREWKAEQRAAMRRERNVVESARIEKLETGVLTAVVTGLDGVHAPHHRCVDADEAGG